MDGFEGGSGGFQMAPPNPRDLNQPSSNSAVFDAAQYAFFGNDVLEEVELGGLDDGEDDIPSAGLNGDDYQLDQEEGGALSSLSEVDDLTGTFSKLNTFVGQRHAGVIGSNGSRESSSMAEWAQETDFPLFDQPIVTADGSNQDEKRWSSHPYSSVHAAEKALYRTSSYPEQQQQQHQHQIKNHHFPSEPNYLSRTSSLTSYPPGVGSQPGPPNYHSHNSNAQYYPGGPQRLPSPSNPSPLATQVQLNASSQGSQFGGNISQYNNSMGLSVSGRPQNQWVQQNGAFPGDRSNLMSQHPLAHQNGLVPPQLIPQQQQQQLQQQQQHQQQQSRLNNPFQQSYGPLTGLQSQLLSTHLPSAPPMMNKHDPGLGFDWRDQRPKMIQRGRPNFRYPIQGFDMSGLRNDNGWPQFRSKYMSTDEIENILRVQLAATHGNDPYIDDYYHQACLAKKSAGGKLRHHFCPTHLRDLSPRARPNSEPHAYLQVDALGRVAFPSIHRPRPLLDVEPPKKSTAGSNEQNAPERPLDEEPMLAARVIIEDGFSLILDVDDIDRSLQFNQFPDGGTQLKRRRQAHLEELASSFHLVDPFVKTGTSVDLVSKDDLVFLRIISLPKGRKLLSRYLQLLVPNDNLMRLVMLAIFRHLRFLFGGVSPAPGTAEAIIELTRVVSTVVGGMELKALAECLASVVCSSEHPPLRPIGSAAGDGASVVLKSVLERATLILTDPRAGANCTMPNRALWQGAFDAFFNLLIKYCFNKYDTTMQSLRMASPEMAASGEEAARAIGGEMPVQLLRASLPHTDDRQRKLLADFAQRSMPVLGANGGSGAH